MLVSFVEEAVLQKSTLDATSAFLSLSVAVVALVFCFMAVCTTFAVKMSKRDYGIMS